MALPAGFSDLAAAYNAAPNTFVHIIGVVVDFMPRAELRTGEYMLTVKLLDPRLRDSAYGSHGLTARFFKKDPNTLPKVQSIGDVFLLRNMKMISFKNQPFALSNHQTMALVFSSGSIPDPGFSIAFQGKNRLPALGISPLDVESLTLLEQTYVINVRHELDAIVKQRTVSGEDNSKKRAAELSPPANPIKKARWSTFGPKFRLVEELAHRLFADICGQVVKKFANQYGTCELYITDYTENELMWYYSPPEEEIDRDRDGDQFGYNGPPKKEWRGPWGYQVLKVNVKDPHAHFANNKISEGDFVLLKNVKMKIMNVGAKLEGDMWPDDRNPERVQITKVVDQEILEIKTLLTRKKNYWASRPIKLQQPSHEELPKGESKKKKNKFKKERLKKGKANGEIATAAEDSDNEASTTIAPGVVKTNPHVRCKRQDQPVVTVRDVIDPTNRHHSFKLPDGTEITYPFVNMKCLLRVRVVGFFPTQIEDFAFLADFNESSETPHSPQITDYESSPRWEWFFSLLLEDVSSPKVSTAVESERLLWVNVKHNDAQYLLGRDVEDPENLRTNPQLLSKLKEKLFILWGNLEEKNEHDALNNRPFECCVVEYGQPFDDDDPERLKWPPAMRWKKLHDLVDTTIL